MTGEGLSTHISTPTFSFICTYLAKMNSFGMFYMFYFAAAGAEIAATSHSCSVRLHLNLPTQPRLKLLTDDPHTAVSVAEAAFKRILQLGTFRFECSR